MFLYFSLKNCDVVQRQVRTTDNRVIWVRFSSSQPILISNAACPGGEGAVLKTVGLKGLVGSNPMCCAIWTASKVGQCIGLKNQVFPFDSEAVRQIWADMSSWRWHLTVNQRRKIQRRFESCSAHHILNYRRSIRFPKSNPAQPIIYARLAQLGEFSLVAGSSPVAGTTFKM